MDNYVVGKREKLDSQNLTKEETKPPWHRQCTGWILGEFNRDKGALLCRTWMGKGSNYVLGKREKLDNLSLTKDETILQFLHWQQRLPRRRKMRWKNMSRPQKET